MSYFCVTLLRCCVLYSIIKLSLIHIYSADDQQSTDHQHHSDQQVDKHVLDQAGQDDADERCV